MSVLENETFGYVCVIIFFFVFVAGLTGYMKTRSWTWRCNQKYNSPILLENLVNNSEKIIKLPKLSSEGYHYFFYFNDIFENLRLHGDEELSKELRKELVDVSYRETVRWLPFMRGFLVLNEIKRVVYHRGETVPISTEDEGMMKIFLVIETKNEKKEDNFVLPMWEMQIWDFKGRKRYMPLSLLRNNLAIIEATTLPHSRTEGCPTDEWIEYQVTFSIKEWPQN